MAKRSKASGSKSSKLSKTVSAVSKLAGLTKGGAKKKSKKQSITALATELARIRLKRKIRAEKLKVTRI